MARKFDIFAAPRAISGSHKLVAAFLFATVLSYLYVSPGTLWPRTGTVAAQQLPLRILLPATTANTELCKLIVSANILGYPTPILINWDRQSDFVNPDWRSNGTHIDKLVGVARYLETHAAELATDIILVLDGYDTWFQLPPSVLLKRFEQLNARYTDYIADVVGGATASREDFRQRIVFPAQKECGPKDSGDLRDEHPGCYAVPPSPLPGDLYGPRTDIIDSRFPWRVRPHWVNSGFIMGPRREMGAMYAAAQSLIDTFDHGGSDQLIFSKLFGEQWYQRHVMSEGREHMSSPDVPVALATSLPNVAELQPMPRLEGRPLEFSIGLDYSMELSHSQVFSETDARFLVYNESASLAAQQALTDRELNMGYGLSPPRVTLPLAADLTALPAPFSTLSSAAADSWNEVPLYTNMYAGQIPVTIHMNGMKKMRQQLWPRMWYHRRLRDLMRVEARRRKIGALDEQGRFMSWPELCGSVEEEVFGSG